MSFARPNKNIFRRQEERAGSKVVRLFRALPRLHRRLLGLLLLVCLVVSLWPDPAPTPAIEPAPSKPSTAEGNNLSGEISLFDDDEAVIHDLTDLYSRSNTGVFPEMPRHSVEPAEPADGELPITGPTTEPKLEKPTVSDGQQPLEDTEFVDYDSLDSELELEPDELVSAIEAEQEGPVWHHYQVSKGDNLTQIFKQLGLPTATMYQLLRIEGNGKPLTRLRPGQAIDYQLGVNDELLSFKVEVDRKNSLQFDLNENGKFERKQLVREGEMVQGTAAGVIRGSFYNSARKAGLEPGQIQYFANIFQWKVDFSRNLHEGDSFAVVYEKELLDGEVTGRGHILAASLTNRGKTHNAFRHSDGKYYNLEGMSLSNAFLRYPVDGTYRISSHFNPRRRHPITRRVSPHNGTDFAVPTGTAVLAAGAGVVTHAGYNRLAGNYIVIKHGRQYTTRYLHLSKLQVKKGQRVKLGQRIARSGNTGRSTGPHLHYEFHVNGRPVDAMKVKLPMSERMGKSDLAAFRKYAQPLLAQLEQTETLLVRR